jgi:cytochrome c biogenesis protein CcmG/thiol:disulfide interchange protein DsbE
VKRLLAFTPLLVLALLAAMFVGWSLKRDPHVRPAALVGKPLPAIAVAPLAGGAPEPLNTAVKGPALVNVFASWCAPCREEHPELLRLSRKGVRIIGVAWKDDPAKTRALLEEIGDPYQFVLADQDGRAGIELGVSGVPETYAVDKRGMIVAKESEPMTPETADRLATLAAR